MVDMKWPNRSNISGGGTPSVSAEAGSIKYFVGVIRSFATLKGILEQLTSKELITLLPRLFCAH